MLISSEYPESGISNHNGKTSQLTKPTSGGFDMKIPGDREGSVEPEIVQQNPLIYFNCFDGVISSSKEDSTSFLSLNCSLNLFLKSLNEFAD